MKPLGTITMYYRFVDDETQTILDSIMKQAYNYRNFTTLLCERALIGDTSKSVLFLAYLHAFKISAFEEMEILSKRYAQDPIIRPYHMWMRSYGGVDTDWEKTREAIRFALSMDLEDWMTAEMHLLSLLAYGLQPHWGPEEDRSLSELDTLLSKDPSLECFSHSVLYYHSILSGDDTERALDYNLQSLEVAKKFDDRLSVANIHTTIAMLYLYSLSDTKQASELLQIAKNEFENLGSKYGVAMTRDRMGDVARHRGEFSLAIKLYQEAMSYMERVSHPHEYIVLALAESYFEAGDYQATIDLASMGLSTVGHVPYFWIASHLQLAQSKAELGMFEESEHHLGIAKETIYKSGREGWLASYHESSGILERAEMDLESAVQSFTESYRTSLQNNDNRLRNKALLRLAETEVMQFQGDDTSQSKESSGPWLDKLQSIASEKDLPGILALALLLRAELRFKQNRRDDAFDILRQVNEMTKQPGLEYLKEHVSDLKRRAGIISDF